MISSLEFHPMEPTCGDAWSWLDVGKHAKLEAGSLERGSICRESNDVLRHILRRDTLPFISIRDFWILAHLLQIQWLLCITHITDIVENIFNFL